jgi:hypothetical protein
MEVGAVTVFIANCGKERYILDALVLFMNLEQTLRN